MRSLLLVTTLALVAGIAQASNGFFYFGAGVASSQVNNQPGLAGADTGGGNSWQVFAGIRPIKLLAIEADYVDLGSRTSRRYTPMECVDFGSCAIGTKSQAKAFSGYAVGFLPLPVPYLDLYGKAGLASYKSSGSTTDYDGLGAPISSTGTSENGSAFTWGLGLQAHVGLIGGRLEYEGFSKATTSVFSLSIFVNL